MNRHSDNNQTYEAQTPPLVIDLFKATITSDNMYVPLIANSNYIVQLAEDHTVTLFRPGMRISESVALRLDNNPHITLVDSQPLELGDIVLDPPFNIRSQEMKYGLRDESLISFTDALYGLTDGKAIIVTAASTVHRAPELKWLTELRENGIYLQAVVLMPSGMYDNTMLATTGLIFSRQESGKYLSVELNDDNKMSSLDRIQNWLGRKEKSHTDSNLIEFVSNKPLITADKLRRDKRLEKLYKEYGYPKINILASAEVRGVPHGESFEDQVNAIYLPLIGNGPVVTTSDDMTMKNASNYAQIVLDPAIDAQYVARWLNTSTGQLVRQNMLSVGYIPKINLSALRGGGLWVPLPEPNEQRQISEIQSKINTAIAELENMRSELDLRPKKFRTINSAFEQMVQTNTNAWIENLPAHLSILLKRYLAGHRAEKYDLLLKFFEALNYTFAAMYFTYLKNNPKVWDHFVQSNPGLDLNLIFRESTFGPWYRFMSTSQNYLRKYLEVKDMDAFPNHDVINQCLKIEDDRIIAALLNGKISHVCNQALTKRNMRSHEFDMRNQLQLAIQYLDDLRPVLVEIFGSYKLINYKEGLPGEDELRSYRVQILHGTSVAFDDMTVQLEHGLGADNLYLHEAGAARANKLQPLLTLQASPADARNTIYYYDHSEDFGAVYKPYIGGQAINIPNVIEI